ncbi:ATP-binding cassette domain-containing protein [uncultured Proteiniphilum sp.]|uniref:ATP-binding cassette domain-containing protein n=1 Tax=uncultured Proteiniphilum sp. TaxID=497637 RepID=UPI002606A856|nr:ATP-binding cassette domain-containing protein [uncultured Proteiniphilum sp.]
MKHTLEISGIRLLFGERLILSDVYLKIETGSIVGLLGQNGSGKSCLMRGVYGTLACEKSVSIDDVYFFNVYKQPQLMRYLPQHYFIPKWLSLKRIFRDFCIDFQVFVQLFPEFQGRENARIGHLSGGMYRLVELYVTLKSDTQFILLDEPFTHISPVQVNTIKTIINEERNRKGFLITDHLYTHIVRFCDNVYLLRDGKTNAITTTDDLNKLGYIRS